MKLEDVTMQDLISKPLFWEDFEEDRADSNTMKAAIEADPKSIEKIRFLDQVEEGTLLDRRTFHKLDFYEVEFTEYARLYLAEGEYMEDGIHRGNEVDYLKDYSGLRLLIQDVSDPLGECGLFALYIKDYEFGLINRSDFAFILLTSMMIHGRYIKKIPRNSSSNTSYCISKLSSGMTISISSKNSLTIITTCLTYTALF